MAKPKLDFKKLMLEKGERIGVGLAGGLAGLLIVLSLLLPGRGLLSGSPTEKAKSLKEPTDHINAQLANPNNKPGEADKPGKAGDERMASLDVKPIEGGKYRLEPLIPSVAGAATLGRRPPTVFPVAEAVVSLARMQIPTYISDNGSPPKFMALREKEKGSSGPSATPGRSGRVGAVLGAGSPMMGNMMARMGGAGMGGAGMGGAGMGRMGMGRMGMGMGMGNLRTPAQLRGGEDAKPRKDPFWVEAKDIDKLQEPLAERVTPLRMAIIAASFPYRKELEEFRNKLGLRNLSDVLAEQSKETVKGQPLANFRFLRVELQRRELDADGKPVKGKEDFLPVPLKDSYAPYFILNGGRKEEDAPEIKQLVFDGLVMPRLKQFGAERESQGGMPGMAGMARMAPPGPAGAAGMRPPGSADAPDKGARSKTRKNRYPPVEQQLAGLRKTIEALKGKSPTAVAAPPSRFRGIDDVFAQSEPEPADAAKPTNTTEGDAEKGEKPELTEPEYPEYCLVRLIDVTIEPGKRYEYQLRVVMANPNYDRPNEVAAPTYSKGKELEPSPWFKVPTPLYVDPELHYYAVDQRKVEEAAKPPRKYTGPNAYARFDENRQVWLQAQRWVDAVPIKDNPLYLGEWTAAERFSAFRGEYVGRVIPVQVPYWDYLAEDFVMADDRSSKGRNAKPTIQIDFGYNAGGDQPEAIVVDFQSGKRAVEKITGRNEEGKPTGTVKVSDEAGEEVLLLDPNGKLELLEGALEADDPQRVRRLEEIHNRVDEVANPSKKKESGGGTDKFGQ